MRGAVRRSGCTSILSCSVSCVQRGVLAESLRGITSRGQFNPIHDFSYLLELNVKAKDKKQFENMISNPGPLRVRYSADYLDWLYRAYCAKVKNADVRHKTETMFEGRLLSSSDAGHAVGLTGSGMQYMRPAHSIRRRGAERLRRNAQKSITQAMIGQGMLDLFERQSQFPVIHINKADRFHVVALFKEIILDKALEPHEIWDKALLYRAILAERRSSYPESFEYIFEAVDNTALSPSGPSEGAGHQRFRPSPTEDQYVYFLYLVKKYFILNSVEGHVVLRCHREQNSNFLLFSVPPPKSDEEIKKALFQNSTDALRSAGTESKAEDASKRVSFQPPAPSTYPPIQALWRCEENFPLLLLLVFGELNLMVTDNPFKKFPNAHAFLTRPYSTSVDGMDNNNNNNNSNRVREGARAADSRRDLGSDAFSLANIIEDKRGSLLPSLPRSLATAIDGRARDLRRLRQRYHREDILAHQNMLKGPDPIEKAGNYSAFSDWAYFNPRAVRSEERDQLQQKALNALKDYDNARREIYRYGYDEAEEQREHRPVEGTHTLPSYIPSIPHFLSAVEKDSHISFLLHVVLPSSLQQRLEKLCLQLANTMHATALEYHKEDVRRINRQKIQVAAVLLDNFVSDQWKRVLEGGDSDLASVARRLGAYQPFETRALDDTGFTTSARMDDFARWMAPPQNS